MLNVPGHEAGIPLYRRSSARRPTRRRDRSKNAPCATPRAAQDDRLRDAENWNSRLDKKIRF